MLLSEIRQFLVFISSPHFNQIYWSLIVTIEHELTVSTWYNSIIHQSEDLKYCTLSNSGFTDNEYLLSLWKDHIIDVQNNF